jgi:hypothetical protein
MSTFLGDEHQLNPGNFAQGSLSSLIPTLREYLTIEEELQIHQQFLGSQWRPNKQVLWSGMAREEAQRWADKHNMQTLTTAMGSLMNPSDPLCLKRKKTKLSWITYIKGASAVFAWHISKGKKVTVLSPPPPQKSHPSGLTTYQAIEEPILKWAIACGAVLQIDMVHPTVKGAENFQYQIWPVDQTATWIAAFKVGVSHKYRWRMVKLDTRQVAIKKGIQESEKSLLETEPIP